MADGSVLTTPSTLTTPAAVTAPSLDAYKNPYTSDVLDSAMKNLNLVGAQRRNQIGTEAFSSGAFGDARNGIENGNLDKDLGTAAGQLTAGINSDAYDKAMGWMNTDVQRQTDTSLANANLDNQWFNNQLSAIGLGNQIQNNAVTQGSNLVNANLGLDTYDKNQQQTVDNVGYQNFLDSQNWDAIKLNQFLGFVNGAPGQTGTTSTTSSPDNSWASLIGSALSGLTSGGTNIFKSTAPIGSTALGAAGGVY